MFQLHFSRKCAERPFENILSILAKYPWHQSHRVLPLHRDHIFELLKLSIESLRMHLSKEYNTIHPTLLTRMVRCAVLTPAFTERQKNMVLVVAGVTCPEDIVGWMAPSTPIEAAVTPLDYPDELSVAAEDAEVDIVIPSDPDPSLAKDEHESAEVKSIEAAIECLGISESASGGGLGERSKTIIATDAASPVIEPKEKPNMLVTAWAAVVAPSAQAVGSTESVSNESTPTATPASSSNTSHKSGARGLTLAPSYAAAVVKTTGGDVTPKASAQAFQNQCGNLALGSNESGSPSSPTSLGSLVAHSGSNAWKSLGSHYRHSSGRSLSISGISSFASPNTQLMPVGTVPYTFPSLPSASAADSTVSSFRSAFLKSNSESFGGDGSGFGAHSTALIASGRHHRGGSLPKLAIPRGTSETTSSSTTASSASSLVATPFNMSPVLATPVVTGEKSTSESILNAIKTITQSTPRLTKSGSVNQMPMSASSTLLSGTTSATGQSSGSIGGLGLGHKQQRRECGETL